MCHDWCESPNQRTKAAGYIYLTNFQNGVQDIINHPRIKLKHSSTQPTTHETIQKYRHHNPSRRLTLHETNRGRRKSWYVDEKYVLALAWVSASANPIAGSDNLTASSRQFIDGLLKRVPYLRLSWKDGLVFALFKAIENIFRRCQPIFKSSRHGCARCTP